MINSHAINHAHLAFFHIGLVPFTLILSLGLYAQSPSGEEILKSN